MHNLYNIFCDMMTNVFFILVTENLLKYSFLKNFGSPENFLAPWPETQNLVPVTLKAHVTGSWDREPWGSVRARDRLL